MKKQFIAFAITFALGIASQNAVAMAPAHGGIAPKYGTLSGLCHAGMQTFGSTYKAGFNALAMPVNGVKTVSNLLYLPVTVLQNLCSSHKKIKACIAGTSAVAYLLYLIATCPTQGLTSHEHFAAITQFSQNYCNEAAVGSLVIVINALLANMKKKAIAVPVILATIIGIMCMSHTAPDGLMSHPFIQSILNGSINFASDAAGQIALFLESCPEYAATLRQFMCENFQKNCLYKEVLTPLQQAQQSLNCSDVSQLIDGLRCTDLLQPSECSQVSDLIQNLNCTDLMQPSMCLQVSDLIQNLNCTDLINPVLSCTDPIKQVVNGTDFINQASNATANATALGKYLSWFKIF